MTRTNDFSSECRLIAKQLKADQRIADDNKLHYEMGVSAAWRGDSADAMPKFKRQNRMAAWLKGHADGLTSYQDHKTAAKADKAGLQKLCAVMRAALEATT